jgi:hypothetical protein
MKPGAQDTLHMQSFKVSKKSLKEVGGRDTSIARKSDHRVISTSFNTILTSQCPLVLLIQHITHLSVPSSAPHSTHYSLLSALLYSSFNTLLTSQCPLSITTHFPQLLGTGYAPNFHSSRVNKGHMLHRCHLCPLGRSKRPRLVA